MSRPAATGEPGRGGGPPRALFAVAGLWGFAEATLFFVVPDVALSFVALRSRRLALACCLWAFAGALAGGALMYGWGVSDPAAARSALERVPLVDRAMVERVRGEIARRGAVAVATGPARATPYKIYAVEAGARGMAFGAMLAGSLPSRLGRFLLVTLIAAWAARGPLRRWPPERHRHLLIAVWVAVYVALILVAPAG